MVAGIEQRRDGKMQRGHAARRADRADAAFQRGEPLFEHRRGRVRNPGVDMSGAFEIEQRRGMLGILKNVGSGLIDRDCTRARDGIRMLAGMEAQGLETRAAWVRACRTRKMMLLPDGPEQDVP